MAERIASIVGLDIAGIDVIAPTLEQPVKKVGGAVIEVNAAPGLRMHLAPAVGTPPQRRGAHHGHALPARARRTTSASSPSPAPTARRRRCGSSPTSWSTPATASGMTTTDGIYVRGRLIAEGDMSGPYSAQVVLRDPLVDCAVLETARGGILRSGLGYKTADVGVVLNVQPDHLGLQNIRDLDELAKVKAVVAEAVREGGTTVLNADDPKCVDMLEYCREHVVFFSLRSLQPGRPRARRPRPHRRGVRAGLHRRPRRRPPDPGGAHRGRPAHAWAARRSSTCRTPWRRRPRPTPTAWTWTRSAAACSRSCRRRCRRRGA